MTYDVILTLDAMTDLEDIYDYIYNHDSPSKAEYVFIYVIIDARRNLQEVLLQRLLACPP